MKAILMVLAAGLLVGCKQENQGNAPERGAADTGSEKGVSSNLNAVGSSTGPLAATNSAPYGSRLETGRQAFTNTTVEQIIKGGSGTPAPGTEHPEGLKPLPGSRP